MTGNCVSTCGERGREPSFYLTNQQRSVPHCLRHDSFEHVAWTHNHLNPPLLRTNKDDNVVSLRLTFSASEALLSKSIHAIDDLRFRLLIKHSDQLFARQQNVILPCVFNSTRWGGGLALLDASASCTPRDTLQKELRKTLAGRPAPHCGILPKDAPIFEGNGCHTRGACCSHRTIPHDQI